jgi:hypothetical protein
VTKAQLKGHIIIDDDDDNNNNNNNGRLPKSKDWQVSVIINNRHRFPCFKIYAVDTVLLNNPLNIRNVSVYRRSNVITHIMLICNRIHFTNICVSDWFRTFVLKLCHFTLRKAVYLLLKPLTIFDYYKLGLNLGINP